jgi:ABC-type multidrug transport system permease subunit
MKRSLTVALREVRSYLADKADLAFSLLLPVAIFALMYGAFGGGQQFHGTASVVDQDGGPYAARLLERLRAVENIDVQSLSAANADSRLERSELLLVTYIPAGFSERIASGEPAQLVIRQRGNGGTEGQIVASIVRGVAEQLNREFQIESSVERLVAGKNIATSEIRTTVEQFIAKEAQSPLVGVAETTVGNSPDPIKQFLPGIITMFVLFAISLGAQVIVDERKKGTLERLLTTRLTRGELFAGKFLSGVFRGFLQTVILLALTWAVFGLFTPISFLEVLVIALVFAAAASALGLVIAAFARTADQATWIAIVFTMVSVVLGGTFFHAPEGSLFDTLSRFSLNTHANDAFVAIITEGKSLSDVWGNVGLVALVAAVALVISRLFFKPVPGGK